MFSDTLRSYCDQLRSDSDRHSLTCTITDKLQTDREINLEPIDGAAVNQRRKHAKSVAEGISNRTHCEYYVKILLHSFYEVVVHRQRRHFKLTTLQQAMQVLKQLTQVSDSSWISYL